NCAVVSEDGLDQFRVPRLVMWIKAITMYRYPLNLGVSLRALISPVAFLHRAGGEYFDMMARFLQCLANRPQRRLRATGEVFAKTKSDGRHLQWGARCVRQAARAGRVENAADLPPQVARIIGAKCQPGTSDRFRQGARTCRHNRQAGRHRLDYRNAETFV